MYQEGAIIQYHWKQPELKIQRILKKDQNNPKEKPNNPGIRKTKLEVQNQRNQTIQILKKEKPVRSKVQQNRRTERKKVRNPQYDVLVLKNYHHPDLKRIKEAAIKSGFFITPNLYTTIRNYFILNVDICFRKKPTRQLLKKTTAL